MAKVSTIYIAKMCKTNRHKTFDSFSYYIIAVINSFKLVKISMDNISEEYFIS